MLKLIIYLRPFAKYLLIAWLLTMIILSSLPNIPTLKIHTHRTVYRIDYLLHFLEYGILTFMAQLAFTEKLFKINYKIFILITFSLIFFAFLDELHQKIIPGRSYSLKDFASDTRGILIAVIFTLLVFRSIRIKMNKPNNP